MRQYSAFIWVALIVSTGATGCIFGGGGKAKRERAAAAAAARAKLASARVTLAAVDLSDAAHPAVRAGGVELAAARDEWAGFALQVAGRAPNAIYSLRLNAPQLPDGSARLDPGAFEVSQVLSMPVDVNRAGFVRHTGLTTSRGDLPRALIPMRSESGVVDISGLRDATRPTDPAAAAPSADPALLWVDLHVPPGAAAGQFGASVEVLANGSVVASVPLKLTVYDFALPAERHLQVVGRLGWDDLVRLYPDRFEAIRPHLMNRGDPRYAGAVGTIDALLALAHRHRAAAVVTNLHPVVKWPVGAPPEVTWADYDSLVGPWLTGQAFGDGLPIGFWPLPAPTHLARYDRASQLQYWANAATHFDQNDWLGRSPVWIEKVRSGRATDAEAAELSAAAAETLAVHTRVRALVPLEPDQLLLAQGDGGAAPVIDVADDGAADGADKRRPREIDPVSTTRLWAAAPGLVFAPPMRHWPAAADQPLKYLRTDQPIVPYVGAGGDERDVRLWAWLAYLRQARLIHWNAALPSLSSPTEPADPNEMIWFYPGEWFGLDRPVPTIQLKWLRRAQQDFEYLWLARDRADRAEQDGGGRDVRINTLLMSQLVSKPVEIQPGQNPDPAYALMSGTTNQAVWDEAQRLLAEMILLHPPADAVDPVRRQAILNRTLAWAEPQERPLLMGRTTEWFIDPDARAEPRLHLRFGVDIYNASAVTPAANQLAWTGAPAGWQIAPQPAPVPVLATYKVHRATLDARFDLDKVTPDARDKDMELTFTNGFNQRPTSLKVVLPVATSERREGGFVRPDGNLADDWSDADLVQDGPLVKMLSRPGIQAHQLERAELPAKVYTSWTGASFLVAFDLNGISPGGVGGNGNGNGNGAAAAKAQNFVDYQFRRAWGEDLCEILVQPVSNAGAPGPVLHVVCKPNGGHWVERKVPAPPGGAAVPGAKAWQEVPIALRYASRPDGERWRGEVAIPWRAILDNLKDAGEGVDADPPALLRFNFVQHRTATGESATWSGPVDFGRDDSLMGVLHLRDPQDPNADFAGDRASAAGGSSSTAGR